MHTQRLTLSARRGLSARAGLSALAVTGLLATAACGTESGDDSGSGSVGSRPAAEITGKQWNVESVTVDGTTRKAPAGAHIEFGKDGKVGGNYGCNHFGASAEIEGDTIKISDDTIKTKMACTTEGTMDFESQLGGAISGSTVKAEVDDGKLKLTTQDGYTVNLTAEKPAELYGTKWNVTSMVKGDAKGDSAVPLSSEADGKVHLTFGEDGTVRGQLGCNRVTAKATVGDGSITLGTAGTTRKMCSASLMDTEKALLKLFDSTVKYQLKGSTLTLTSENGTGVEAVAGK
ncbi:META domain-containing protein [Streptomyces albicerus]|uniref:META domain-containing protein n=1 Tax=Streptomyces albicerus TaxID=2569859 RepID=UPI00124B624F|nr:META domain-containing protein [Streptomyces albicerus]